MIKLFDCSRLIIMLETMFDRDEIVDKGAEFTFTR